MIHPVLTLLLNNRQFPWLSCTYFDWLCSVSNLVREIRLVQPLFTHFWFLSAISVAFSVVVLGLSADLIETTLSFLGAYFYFTPLAITSAAITTLTAPVLWVGTEAKVVCADRLSALYATLSGRGPSPPWLWSSYPGCVCFYLARMPPKYWTSALYCLAVLWVLWLATAAEAVVANQFMYPEGCALADGNPALYSDVSPAHVKLSRAGTAC